MSQVPAPRLEVTASPRFTQWLADERISLGFTTYQAGKLFLVSRKPDGGFLAFERSFNRSMGLCAHGNSLFLGTAFQVWKFENFAPPGQLFQGHDRFYVPQVAWTTGDIDIHDIAVEEDGRIVFVNTQFGCLATVSAEFSFVPVWQPPFQSKLAGEDRCHLNGLALEKGRAKYVTYCGATDVTDGWRDRRDSGGEIMDVTTNEVVLRGLSMPHSPRVYRDQLWVLNSGTGEFGRIDRDRGKFEPLAFCPGYLRGLCFSGDYAIVGVSKPRNRTFAGLQLDENLASRNADARCGLYVIDLNNGDVVHWLRLEGVIAELYDVAVLPETLNPTVLGLMTDEIKHIIRPGDASGIWTGVPKR
ncbi:MAG: TIGR03032 family protein [Planctomycetales bacterium]